MGKVKNVLAVLLTVLLLAGGSLLPVAATRFQDKTTTNVVQYENIEALQLRLEEETLSMTYQEKLFLINQGVHVEVTGEHTQLREDMVLETVYGAMTPYMELFLGKNVDNDYIHYYPSMVYNEQDPSRYAYYWYVTMSLDVSHTDSITMILDDETGKLLAIEMNDPEWNLETEYLQDLQFALSEIYFEELGITPTLQWPIAVEATTPEIDAMGISVVAAHYQFADLLADSQYDVIGVEIGVRTDGVYIYIV